ncbi:hypothetical protein V8E36_009892 [Tilletia maclaganii]
MFALVSAAFWQRLMLLRFFTVAVLLSFLSDGRSFTIPLQQANLSVFFHPNGSLDAVRSAGHTRYIRYGYCLAQQKNHRCGHEILPLHRRERGQLSLHEGAFGSAPTMTISVGAQTMSVIFDTAALVSIIDPAHYSPERSSTAHNLQAHHQALLANGCTTKMVRWQDLISIAGLNALATFDRSEQPIFNPAVSAAGGMLAFSKHDSQCENPLPLIYVLQQKQHLDRQIFSFSLPRSQYFGGPPETGGKLTLGQFDRSMGLEALRYSSVQSGPRFRHLWATSGSINSHQAVMILHTVSAFIVLPIQLARTLFSQLNLWTEELGNSLFARYHCANWPSIIIRIGASTIVLRPGSLQFGAQHEGWCTLSIIGEHQEEITLGRPFFENAYTVIDLSGWVGLRKA